MTSTRRLTHVLAAGLLLAAAGARAQDTATCWNRSLERFDYFINPPEGGDNSFFTAIANQTETTNVTLLYPAKASMKEFIIRLPRIKGRTLGGSDPLGCNNEYLNNLTYFMPSDLTAPAGDPALQGKYNKGRTYPDPGPKYSGGGGQRDGLTVNKAYRYTLWGANGTGVTAETPDEACTNAGGEPFKEACKKCLDDRGYWLNPLAPQGEVSPRAGVFSTNWLRFHPPKWVQLSIAYKRLVNGPLLSVLREAVVATNGTTGGKIVQKMLPQSCSGQGRPINQKLGAIDGLSYEERANPLAELLFNAAWYMGGQNEPWHFGAGTIPGGAMRNGKSGPCDNCSGDFLVLFSDGRGDAANPNCAGDVGVRPSWCTERAQCSSLGMGPEDDGNNFLDPDITGGAGALISGTGARQTPGGTCSNDFADDVARWMYENPTSTQTNASKIRTYVVAIGDKANPYGELTTLKEIAAAGGTSNPIYASNFRELERGIEDVIKLIISNATSFSTAAVPSVQTRGSVSAFIPRFRPGDGPQWNGTLTRFDLFNEFAAGCTAADYGVKNERNPNGDSSCNEVYLRDDDGAFVGENERGDFVRLNTSGTWSPDGGWPLARSADGGTILAEPMWEASAKLNERMDDVIAGSAGAKKRDIFTAKWDPVARRYAKIRFDLDNLATVTPLLALGGYQGDFCTTLAAYTRHTYASDEDCAADVIKFMHGEDVLLKNPDNRADPAPAVLKSRPNILGDIFHSSPVLVTPPVGEFICDRGLANQCLVALYRPELTPGGPDAYKEYRQTYLQRDQFVLVAANDGMLHAFNAGVFRTQDGIGSYDFGSGEELWAFIPPDILPKLIRYVVGERHELLVDGTPMVRDVWVDGSGTNTTVDHTKQADEFHTVAVVGEREGGRHFFALDVTRPSEPEFLWSFPAPGETEALVAGGSWNDLGPGAPPIGPIPQKDPNGKLANQTTPARERWVVGLGGGYDSSRLRGRAIYLLDVWSGEQVYRFAHQDASGSADLRNHLGSVAAPVSLVESESGRNPDWLFDTLVVGDTAGQVWTINMKEPGEDTDGDGRFDNWPAARSFIQFKGEAFSKRSPFFQRASIDVGLDGTVRALLGSGDRANIKEPNGGTCSLSNLTACMRKGCSVTVNAVQHRVGPAPAGTSSGHRLTGGWTYTSSSTALTPSISYGTQAGAVCSDVVDVDIDYTITCGGTTVSHSSDIYCDWGASGGLECPTGLGRPVGTRLTYNPATAQEYSRFYQFKLFDQGGARARFTMSTAAAYDAAALTDANLKAPDAPTLNPAGTLDNGWLVVHNQSRDEKTASASLLFGGCVLWNTLEPSDTTTVACGQTTLPPDSAFLYQADLKTGAAGCGTGVRAIRRNTHIAPQQPSPIVSINTETGEVNYSAVIIEAGSPPISVSVGGSELVGPLKWREVSREEHVCRHEGQCK